MNQDGIPSERVEELLERLLDHPGVAGEIYPDLARLPERNLACPEDEVWPAIASGEPGKHDARILIDHAAGCQRCGAMLSYWSSVLCDEESAEESQALSRLSSLSAAWQHGMTARLSGTKPPGHGRLPQGAVWPALVAMAGAVAAGTIFFLFMSSSRREASPEKLLAEAYAGHRIMEMRIPLAGFANIDAAHHTRSGEANAGSDVVPLLEARAAISQALLKMPEDPKWLQLQARADLLNENYDTAIDTLKRLLSSDAANVNVLIDLASAYNMRAKATDVQTDKVTALDYLERAARADAKNPVALYNEAVLLQELYQYSNAVDVWYRFLTVEHDRAWLIDGRRRLANIEALQAKVKAQQSRLDPLLASPEGMLHLARSPALLAMYDEELATGFLPTLLRAAYPLSPAALPASAPRKTLSAPNETGRAARALLEATAVSLEERHHDQWLMELLRVPVTPVFSAAVNSLANAFADGGHGNPADALREAQAAERGFRESGSASGAAYARVEEMYNLEHLRKAGSCLATAGALPAMLEKQRYPLIEAKFWVDYSGCQGLQNDFGATTAGLDRALRVSSDARYRIVHLRAMSFAAETQEIAGNRETAWAMNLKALKTYWEGDYPAIRLLLPYTSMAEAEQNSSRLYAGVLLHNEAYRETPPLSPPEILNENHFLLVKAEIRAGEVQEARDLAAAEAERSAVPGQHALQGSATDIDIYLAEAYLSRGQLQAARQMLQTASAEMTRDPNMTGGPDRKGDPDRDMELRYAAAAGHLSLLQGQNLQAEADLSHAVTLAELGYRQTPGAQERIDWIKSAREVYAALTLLRLREGRSPVEALAIWERYRILSSGAPLKEWCHSSELDCLADALSAAQKTLRQETVIGTVRLDHSMLLWAMDDRGVQMRELKVDPDRFDLLCHTFSEMLDTPASSETSLRFYGNQLAESLLTPIASTLDPHRILVFDLDDGMEFLPVAALPRNGSYLGLNFATSTVRSMLLAGRPAAAAFSGRSVVVGASDPGDADVSRLPEARSEALTVAAFLARPRVLTGGDAVASSFEASVPHAALIHFAGHTRFADGATRLLLASPAKKGPDWIDARTFRHHDLAGCRLVVLSACSTGKRAERDLGDIQDIVEALSASGVQQIVATHWDVDSEASTLLMKEFYAGLARGLTVPQALLNAERSVSTAAAYRHPYNWAPYYVTGMSTSNLKELVRDEEAGGKTFRKD